MTEKDRNDLNHMMDGAGAGEPVVELRHGAGGEESGRLVAEVFAEAFHSDVLDRMEDAAVLPPLDGMPVMTSDTFVVDPLFFPGGDIGRLAVCGTVNDIACMGARPLYITTAFVLETGLPISTLRKVVRSLAETAREAGVKIVAGDTKVVEGNGGLHINTTGLGQRPADCRISASAMKPGDSLIVTGNLGDHHATILTCRLGMESALRSDCAPLNSMVSELLESGVEVHTIRDITRGGLATMVNELSGASRCGVEVWQENLPVSDGVRGLSGILGLDPLTMGNEGKLLIAVPGSEAERALEIVRRHPMGHDAAIVGSVTEGTGAVLVTTLGSRRKLLPLRGEGLPRIC